MRVVLVPDLWRSCSRRALVVQSDLVRSGRPLRVERRVLCLTTPDVVDE